MRSSVGIVGIVALLGGCDLVFGIDGESTPCEVSSFATATPQDVTVADDFSFDWEETFGVVQVDGQQYELSPADATLTPIDIGPYSAQGLSLTPEGDALFYTIVIEPPTLKGALRGGSAEWRTDAGVPRGTYAGTPSADVFGPRRVMVRMRDGLDLDGIDQPTQEYEDRDGVWTAVGPARVIRTQHAPNLTPDGLTMIYPSFDEVGEPGLFVEQRTSASAPFGDKIPVLAGAFTNAQLLGRCSRLYATDTSMLRRYDR